MTALTYSTICPGWDCLCADCVSWATRDQSLYHYRDSTYHLPMYRPPLRSLETTRSDDQYESSCYLDSYDRPSPHTYMDMTRDSRGTHGSRSLTRASLMRGDDPTRDWDTRSRYHYIFWRKISPQSPSLWHTPCSHTSKLYREKALRLWDRSQYINKKLQPLMRLSQNPSMCLGFGTASSRQRFSLYDTYLVNDCSNSPSRLLPKALVPRIAMISSPPNTNHSYPCRNIVVALIFRFVIILYGF